MPIQQDHAWGTLQIINNKAQVTGIQKDDPGFLPVTAKDYSIKFPALFPTGNEPDDDLPRGTCVAAIVAAENSEGRSVKESNCFMPADVNPEAAAGPITATTPTQLTVASNANLGEFSPGDNLVMVDENNDISDYTIVSDTINSLDTQSYSQPATYNFKSTRNGAENEHLNPPTSNWDSVSIGQSNISYDTYPTEASATSEMFYNFDDKYSPQFYRKSGEVPHPCALWRSDDGISWVFDSQFDVIAGPNTGKNKAKGLARYWCWKFALNTPKPHNYGLEPAGIIVSYIELTLASDQDLAYFREGDVVQGGNSFGITTDLISGSQIGTPEYLFNGVSSSPLNSNGFGCTGNGGEIEATFPNMDKTSGTLKIDYIIETVGSLIIYGPTGNWTVNTQTGTNVYTRSPDLVPFIGNKITKINITNDGGNVSGLTGIYYNDILETEKAPVKVISIDDSVPSITVDGGNWAGSDGSGDPGWNQDQVWSAAANYTGNVYAPEVAFNGLADSNTFPGTKSGNGLVTWRPPSPVSFNTIKIIGWANSDAQTQGLHINDILVMGVDTSGISHRTLDNDALVDKGITSPLESISFGLAGGVGGGFYAVYLDGKLLVDQGVPGAPVTDTEVTYGPVTGTGVFQVADQLNNTMTIQNSNDRWIDNNNRLSKDFYVRDNITVLNADNPKHVAMQQAIADAFDAFPEKVNERRTAIASSFYRLMEGEALSAADYSVLEETVLNAVNAVEPFALNGFYPLYYTSAKADAASSTDSHHSHTINGVTYYMPDGGTLYHGNYIAPETSTTESDNSSSSSGDSSY